jgi:hypothetical protein
MIGNILLQIRNIPAEPVRLLAATSGGAHRRGESYEQHRRRLRYTSLALVFEPG